MNNNFAKFIDELRESRNISREAFVEDIISLRQYYRFQKGESSLKNDVIEQLLNRLEISSLDAYKYYYTEYNDPDKKLQEVYRLYFNNNFRNAHSLLRSVDEKKLINQNIKKFYKLLDLMIEYKLQKTTYHAAATKVLKLINYPRILENEYLSFFEVAGFSFCFTELAKSGDYTFAEKAYEVIMNKENPTNFLSNVNRIPFYAATSQTLGYINDYEKSIQVAEKTLSHIYQETSFSFLAHQYIVVALGARNLNNETLLKESIRTVFMLLKIQNNQEKTKEYHEYIEKVFSLKESDLIIYN